MSCFTSYVIWVHVYFEIIQLIELIEKRVIDASFLIFLEVGFFTVLRDRCTCNFLHCPGTECDFFMKTITEKSTVNFLNSSL